jgi:hypothetical protein
VTMKCAKCSRPIKPGENVNVIGVDELLKEGRRIFAGDETLVTHVSCPSPAGGLEDQDRRVLAACWARKAQLGHVPRTSPEGYTCDEMGCAICNAGDEFVEWAVTAYMEDEEDLVGMRPTDADLLDAAAEYLELARERL